MICYSEIPAGIPNLKCDHKFCKECWTAYLVEKIKGEGVGSLTAKCMLAGCPITVPHSLWMNVLEGKN
jgi:ariadne-1